MRTCYAILLLLPLCFLTMQDLIVHCLFQWNQEVIVAERCIDRFKPVNMCQGSCVLTEMLSAPDEQSTETTLTNVLQLNSVSYLPVESRFILPVIELVSQQSLVATVTGFINSDFADRSFEPPQA